MYLILSSIFFPILAGLFLLIRYRTPLPGEKRAIDRKALTTLTGIFLLITAALVVAALLHARESFTLFYLTKPCPFISELTV